MGAWELLLVAVVLLLGLCGVLVPGVPGSWLVWAGVMWWALEDPRPVAWWVLVGATVVLLVSWAVRWSLPPRRLTESGATPEWVCTPVPAPSSVSSSSPCSARSPASSPASTSPSGSAWAATTRRRTPHAGRCARAGRASWRSSSRACWWRGRGWAWCSGAETGRKPTEAGPRGLVAGRIGGVRGVLAVVGAHHDGQRAYAGADQHVGVTPVRDAPAHSGARQQVAGGARVEDTAPAVGGQDAQPFGEPVGPLRRSASTVEPSPSVIESPSATPPEEEDPLSLTPGAALQHALQTEEEALAVEAARVAREGAVRADHPVAGAEDEEGFAPIAPPTARTAARGAPMRAATAP